MADDIPRLVPAHAVVWRKDARQQEDGRDQGSTRGRPDFARAVGAYERVAGEAQAIEDLVSVQGIPEAELTPAVRRALSRLQAEVDRLRHDQAAGPPHPLAPFDPSAPGGGGPSAEGEGGDPPLPGLDALTPVFEDGMAALMSRGILPAVVFLYMANFEDVRARVALAAALAGYAAMVRAVRAAAEDEETVGTAGGASIIVLSPFDGQVDRLWARARTLARTAAEVQATWRNETIPVRPLVGLHVPRRGESAADALWQADRAARRLV